MAISITTNKIINITVNTAFKIKLAATGGTKPYTWSALTNLPNGVKLNGKGVLKGTASIKGTYKGIKIKVVDDTGASETKKFKIVVGSSTTTTTTTEAPSSSYGSLWMWGNNYYGELADNTNETRSSPVQTISGGTNWKQVSCGFQHAAAIKSNNTLWCWGNNTGGQIGDNTIVPKSSPVQTISGGTDWKQVACGYNHTAAIKTDGTLWGWGYNNAGQLGDNTIVDKSSPVQTIAGGTNWKQVSCGGFHTAAIKTDGTLWLWGGNNGCIGDNTYVPKSSPVQTISYGTNWKQVSCGDSMTTAIKNDGTLWCWGDNSYGNLGDNTDVNRSSPVQTVCGGTNWKQVSSGYGATGAIKTDGTLWCWGTNYYGECGNGSTNSLSSPSQTTIGGTNWKQVSCGSGYTVATKNNGTIWGFGANYSGSLGNNTHIDSNVPVQSIAQNGNYIDIDAHGFTAAIRST